MTRYPDLDWINSGRAEDLLAFAFLPSVHLHESRLQSLLPQGARDWLSALEEGSSAWHQLHGQWSAQLIGSMGLHEISDLGDPALKLALLPKQAWDELRLTAGATLLGPLIRRCISRPLVAAVQNTLGVDLYQFVLRDAPPVPESFPLPGALDLAAHRQTYITLGETCIARAMSAANPPIAERAYLRIPVTSIEAAAHDPWTLLSSQQALAFCISLIQFIEPKWLSSFPGTH